MSDEDVEKLTIPELKTLLSNANIPLPSKNQSKAFYRELYKSEILGHHDSSRNLPTDTTKTPVSERISTTSTKKSVTKKKCWSKKKSKRYSKYRRK